MYVCMHVCMHVCMYVCNNPNTLTPTSTDTHTLSHTLTPSTKAGQHHTPFPDPLIEVVDFFSDFFGLREWIGGLIVRYIFYDHFD